MCVVQPAAGFEGIDERLLHQLISPMARISSMAITERRDKIVARVELVSPSLAWKVCYLLNDREFEWGHIEFLIIQENNLSDCHALRHSNSAIKHAESADKDSHYQNVVRSGTESLPRPENSLDKKPADSNSTNNVDLSERVSVEEKGHVKSPSTSHEEDLRLSFKQKVDKPSPKGNSSSSKVIVLQSLFQKFLNGRVIANILGCFGNVVRAVIDLQSRIAFGEFQSAADVRNTITHLDGTPFFGHSLHLSPAPSTFDLNQFIDQNTSNAIITPIMPRFWRFRNRHRVKLNPPSNLLHITSIDSEADLAFLYSIISLIQEPETIYLLTKRSKESKM